MFDKAILIAANEHLGQRDKGGKAYILHPIRLAMRLRTDDEELMCIAVLHDAVEDGKVTFNDLVEQGFSSRVVNALKLLTHQRGINYEEYIHNMRDNYDALRVKREDLKDNSDLSRLKGISEKDLVRLNKYAIAYTTITGYIKSIENSLIARN